MIRRALWRIAEALGRAMRDADAYGRPSPSRHDRRAR